MNPVTAEGLYEEVIEEPFALDTCRVPDEFLKKLPVS